MTTLLVGADDTHLAACVVQFLGAMLVLDFEQRSKIAFAVITKAIFDFLTRLNTHKRGSSEYFR